MIDCYIIINGVDLRSQNATETMRQTKSILRADTYTNKGTTGVTIIFNKDSDIFIPTINLDEVQKRITDCKNIK